MRVAPVCERHFTRRQFAKLAALLSAGAALPFHNEAVLAQDVKALSKLPADAIRLNANENPMGPCPAAVEAVQKMAPLGFRYHFDQTNTYAEAMAQSEGVPLDHVLPSAGSSDPLHRTVVAFTSPKRPLVIASPGYEAPVGAARYMEAKVITVPLRKDYAHDAKAMAEADTSTGVIYICNPNNPTGTVTPKEDIDYIIANMPKGCVALIDEAYIHFANTATPSVRLVTAGKDVVVLRTFSKLYGMAGLRAGAAIGRPDLLQKIRSLGGLGIMPCTGMAAAVASLNEKSLVPERRKKLAEIREDLFAWLEKRSYGFIRSEANMVMIDTKRPGAQVVAAMIGQKVAIGRTWPALPNHVRVTIGTRDEMAKFKTAFERVMGS